jgi:hypothetical protein
VFEITAVVTDDTGAPVPDVRVVIFNDYAEWPVHTDNTGRYTLNFNAIGTIHYPGLDPAGTENAVAFAYVEAAGYHWHSRFVLGTSQRLVENIRLRRPPGPLTPGESALLTIGPDDTVCGTERWIAADGRWPGRESICQNLSVVALEGGIMNVEAVPTQPGAAHPVLEVSVPVASVWGNPISVRVAAAQEYQVRIAVPWGSNQSFMVKTSMQ